MHNRAMTRIAERTILFADLRGSTALYETLGNAEATSVVTHTVSALARAVPACGGQLIKTLGDGLMAAFNSASEGLQSAQQMHEELEGLVSRGRERGASAGLRGLRLQVALARVRAVARARTCRASGPPPRISFCDLESRSSGARSRD